MRLRLTAATLAMCLGSTAAEAEVTIIRGLESGHLTAPAFQFLSPDVLAPEPGGTSAYSLIDDGGALRVDAPEMLKSDAFGLSGVDDSLFLLTGSSASEYGGVSTTRQNYSELYLTVRTLYAGQISFSFTTDSGSSHQATFDTLGEEHLSVTAIAALQHSIASFSITGPAEFDDVTGRYQYAPVPAGAVPEPAAWAMMVGGFALAGAAARRRRPVAAATAG